MSSPIPEKSSLWKNKPFLILIFASVFLGLGNKIYNLALPLIVYELTESSKWMGWMRAVEFLPNLLLAIFIGVWVDRVNKKRWAITMVCIQAILLVLTFLAIHLNVNPLWALFPAAFLINAASYGYGNAKLVIVKRVLPKQHMNLAIARIVSVSNFFDTLGPVISGALLLVAALHWPLLWVGILYFFALLVLLPLPWQQQVKKKDHPPIFKSLKEGWDILKLNKPLWQITWLVVIINTTSGMFEIQVIYTAKAIYQLNSAQVGLMISLAGAGTFLGAMAAPYIRKYLGLGPTLIWAVLLEALCFLLPILSGHRTGLYSSLFLTGFFGINSSVCIWSYRQESTTEHTIGRVAGITGSIFKLGLPFGLVASGYIVTSFGASQLFLLCTILQLLAIIFVWKKEMARLI